MHDLGRSMAPSPRAFLTLGFVLILSLAGCVGKADLKSGTDVPPAQVDKSFAMTAKNCEQSGWIAMYPMMGPSKLAKVWEQVDNRAEFGNPIHDSVGTPSPLLFPQNGNIHMGFHCAEATVNGVTVQNFDFGAILQEIKA